MTKQRQRSKAETSSRRLTKCSDSEEETELFTLKKKSPKKEIPTLEKSVEEGDTLQSLAIRYSCTIEDLKRLNNIQKENEIFAKRIIKVPIHPISMALAGVHSSGNTSPNRQSIGSDTLTLVDSRKVAASLKEAEVNEIIFNSNITQQHRPNIELNDDFEEDDETVNLLPRSNTRERSTTMNFSGIDGDISPKSLIICIVVLIVVVPLIYVFYIYEHPQSVHGHDS